MINLPGTYSIILVAVMPDVRDLEIARLLGWYRIPLRRAPKIVDVDYLAFYQTGAFGPTHRWRINFFTEVRGHELALRKDLFKEEPDHPRANEEYYKIQIGPLEELPTAIQARKWKRITFLYTTGEIFITARTIEDLSLPAEERKILWRSLRERALSGGRYKADELPEFPIDSDLIALLGGISGMING